MATTAGRVARTGAAPGLGGEAANRRQKVTERPLNRLLTPAS